MREVAAEGVSAQIGPVLPLGRIRRSCPRVAQVAVLDLTVEGEPFVHTLL